MINYIKADLFSHTGPGVKVFLHACNCKGSWGAGVATAFKKHFPSTYDVHRQYCHQFKSHSSDLLGKCQLIKNSPTDKGFVQLGECFVACAFTSDGFGRNVLPPQDILKYTEISLRDLESQLKALDVESYDGKPVVNLPKINSGLFGVPWEDTEEILKRIDLHFNVYYI
ncbi:ADP-ribose 1''-phosphate phosphatase [[Candida] jaroonii]|uniref:ADP-ribose 1''-phosphate phosphatase n=1 Tax=[Candida] jaroonii TaxID=467808 RepID=A0ACA9Y802_9ASCO|nr:ADP-ribose 1''-phosphate phosphatase [[Candida] jaroonii]